MTRERYLSDAELERFMHAVRSRRHVNQARDHALFAILANTGIRPAEALSLTRGDLHLSGAFPWMRVVRCKKRKQLGEFDELPITGELAAVVAIHVDSLADDSRALLFPMQRRQAQRAFAFYRNLAGIRDPHPLYCLRHTVATRLYVATRNIYVVQAVLGHEKADTSTIYAHIPGALLQETIGQMPAVV